MVGGILFPPNVLSSCYFSSHFLSSRNRTFPPRHTCPPMDTVSFAEFRLASVLPSTRAGDMDATAVCHCSVFTTSIVPMEGSLIHTRVHAVELSSIA